MCVTSVSFGCFDFACDHLVWFCGLNVTDLEFACLGIWIVLGCFVVTA